MANQIRVIRLNWENGASFKMDTKLNDESYVTILEMEENGELPKLWNSAQVVCEVFFKAMMDAAGKDMKG